MAKKKHLIAMKYQHNRLKRFTFTNISKIEDERLYYFCHLDDVLVFELKFVVLNKFREYDHLLQQGRVESVC